MYLATPKFSSGLTVELMKEYRKVDDSVTMRMNRTMAQFRDRDRAGMSESTRNSQDQACSYFWTELVGVCLCAMMVEHEID